LTSYEINADGRSVALSLVDTSGNPASLSLQISELGMLAMTLPSLIETALRRQYHDASLRFTYPMGSWIVEPASDPSSVIITLRTTDGFGVSFSMPRARAEQLGASIASGLRQPFAVTAH
jgi:hypothetical protein